MADLRDRPVRTPSTPPPGTGPTGAASTGAGPNPPRGGAPWARRRRTPTPPPWKPWIYAGRVSFVAALLGALALNLSGLLGNAELYWRQTFLTSGSYALDTLVVWLVTVVLIGVTNRVTLSAGIVLTLCGALAVANHTKLELRNEPIYPSDTDFVTQPGLLLDLVAPSTLAAAAAGAVVVLLGCWLVGRRVEPRLPPLLPRTGGTERRARAVLVRFVVVGVALGLLVDTTRFNEPGNLWRQAYETNGDQWHYWDQSSNYRAHGFVGGLLYNMPTEAMPEPVGYSEAAMSELADRWEQRAAAQNAGRTGSLDDTNVVVVLSESFTDPTNLDGFELERDPIPNIRRLMQQTWSGTMMAQVFGGGTANMEFEALTGQSIGLFEPQLNSPYQMLVPRQEEYPSAVGWFETHGHKPVAVHPYSTHMYKRTEVYDILGFDDFVGSADMRAPYTVDRGRFVSDSAAFGEVQRQLRESDDPLLVNLVTMQNHIPVDDSYHDPIGVEGVDGEIADRIGQYARGLEYTDRALASFLAKLEASEEKTVVVFYGDHLPGFYGGSEVIGANESGTLYETPFFLWSSEGNSHRDLGAMGPTHFLPALYDMVDAPLPPYFALLEELRQHVSSLEQVRWVDPEGREVTEDDLDPEGRRLLEEARMVQYDFSIGGRYAVDRLWPGALGTPSTPVEARGE